MPSRNVFIMTKYVLIFFFVCFQKSRQSAYENEEEVSVRNNNNSGELYSP